MDEERELSLRKALRVQIGINVLIVVVAILAGSFIVGEYRSFPSSMIIIEIVLLACLIVSNGFAIYYNRKTMQQLQRMANSRSSMMIRASRDMRTPMNTILNFSAKDMVLDYNPQDMKDALRYIHNSGKYMMMLIEDLLVLSRIKDKKLVLNEKPYTIVECVEGALEMVKSSFQEKKIHFNVEYMDVDKYRYVKIDKIRVEQVLINLLVNAVKFTQEEGHVSLIVEGKGDSDKKLDVTFHIIDDGAGMTQDKVNALLNDKEISSSNPGLGFSIINGLVEALNGKLNCHSKLGEGTEFTVSFKWEYCSKGKEEVVVDYSILKGKHILLVENDMMNAEITRNILSHKNMTMDLATDGKQGVEMFTHAMPHTYDAVLMDIRMPVMDGLEATSHIRQSTHPEAQEIPIIAMTADVLDEDRQKTESMGMNAHITKPIDPNKFYMTLANYIK